MFNINLAYEYHKVVTGSAYPGKSRHMALLTCTVIITGLADTSADHENG
jgi:hypothetical protein